MDPSSAPALPTWRLRLDRYLALGDQPGQIYEIQIRQRLLLVLGFLMGMGGLVWGFLSLYFGFYLPSLIPFGYSLFTLFNFSYFARTKNFPPVRLLQVTLSLVLPFLFQWCLGGIWASGAVMLWALLALIGAFTYQEARYNLAWLLLYLALLLFSGWFDQDFLPFASPTGDQVFRVLFLGNLGIISSIIFALAIFLVQRLSEGKSALIKAERRAAEAKEQAREELLQQQRDQAERLERQVQERTRELQEALALQQKQHQELQEAQEHLIQSEKMASLGTLVAGVAHEINNPNNFVSMNAAHLQEKLQKHQGFLQELLVEEPEIWNQVERFLQEAQQMGKDMAEGCQRIKTIVDDLRSFSRLDEGEMVSADLVELLEASLRMIKSNYKHQVDFTTRFATRPSLLCHPNQLSQVFVNLMANACQAIVAAMRQDQTREKGKLEVSLENNSGSLEVVFTDDGIGMDSQVQQKIFEPFYTTKPVGEGTGLGMWITFGIVERHRGKIQVQSNPGQGSRIALLFPPALSV